jgi:outer membrane protein assembly factor BamB
MSSTKITRREFIPRAAGGVAALAVGGVVGYELRSGGSKTVTKTTTAAAPTPTEPTPTATAPTGLQAFFTEPDLHPPSLTVTNLSVSSATSTPRFILLSPRVDDPKAPGQGLMIVDRRGRMVWFQPTTAGSDFNVSVQPYNGKPSLAWWQGSVQSAHGYGVAVVDNSSYEQLLTIKAGDGLQTDLHDLYLTSRGTAYITAYETRNMDLTSVGGPKSQRTFIGHVQEIDLKTGKMLWDWDCSKYIPVDESYELVSHHGGAFDYIHLNSVQELDDGNLLISGRNTWTLYKVDRKTGEIIWRLNGKKSDFKLGPGVMFYWQHHSRFHGTDVITVFDNAVAKEKQSRGLVLSVDENAMTVSLEHEYVHPSGIDSTALGSVQLLPDGRVFVGWGDQPYFSEFTPGGTMLLDGQMPAGTRSYRAFTQDWVAKPTSQPKIAARADPAGGFVVHASWNGATEIDHWTVLAGAHASSLSPVGSEEWTGFETTIAVNSNGPYFVAVAEDSRGRELGRSAVA